MNPYYIISNAKTFAFSAENPTGTRWSAMQRPLLFPQKIPQEPEQAVPEEGIAPSSVPPWRFAQGRLWHWWTPMGQEWSRASGLPATLDTALWSVCTGTTANILLWKLPFPHFSGQHTMRILWTGMENT